MGAILGRRSSTIGCGPTSTTQTPTTTLTTNPGIQLPVSPVHAELRVH